MAVRPKSPVHLWFLPVVLLAGAGFCFGGVLLVCLLAGWMRPGSGSFNSFGETSKILIVMPLFFASIPLGFLSGNALIWSIPPLRRYFVSEAAGRGGVTFRGSQKGLMKMAAFMVPLMFVFSLAAALWGGG